MAATGAGHVRVGDEWGYKLEDVNELLEVLRADTQEGREEG